MANFRPPTPWPRFQQIHPPYLARRISDNDGLLIFVIVVRGPVLGPLSRPQSMIGNDLHTPKAE